MTNKQLQAPADAEKKAENEKKIEYLSRYLRAEQKRELLVQEIEEMRSTKMSPFTPQLDGMPHGTERGGDLSVYMEKLDTLKAENIRRLSENLRIREEIVLKILEMDVLESQVLRLRYIYGMKMWQIAEKLGHEERQVYRIYKRALKDFQI